MITATEIMSETCGAFKELQIVHDYLYGELDDTLKMFMYLKHGALLDKVTEYEYKNIVEYLIYDPDHHWGDQFQSIDAILEHQAKDEDWMELDDEGRAHFLEDFYDY
jgi:hypothetical protein